MMMMLHLIEIGRISFFISSLHRIFLYVSFVGFLFRVRNGMVLNIVFEPITDRALI